MPLRSFWSASANVTRIRAEESLEMVDLFVVANANCDPAMVTEIREALLKRMGEPAKVTSNPSTSRDPPPEQHREGIAKLRQLLGA